MLVGINQKVTPIKLGFLLKPNSKKTFKLIIETAFSLWGGIYSPIIPIYKKLPENFKRKYGLNLRAIEYYKGVLQNFAPDIIIYDDSLDIDFIKTFCGNRTLVALTEFNSRLLNGGNEYGIEITDLLQHLIRKEFKYKRNDDLNIAIQIVDKKNLFLNTFLGTINPKISEQIKRNLKKESYFSMPEINDLDDIKKINGSISIIDLNILNLTSHSQRHWYRGEYIYFLKPDDLDDLINFWNLRALGSNIVPLPLDQMNTPYYVDLLKRFCQPIVNSSLQINIITFLFDNTLNKNIRASVSSVLNEVKTLLPKIQFAEQSWLPRYWEEIRILEYDKVLCCSNVISSKYTQVESKDNILQFKVKNVPFKIRARYKTILSKVILDFNYFDNEAIYAETLYGIDPIDLKHLLFSYADKWNISKNGIECYLNNSKKEIYLQIPTSFNFFKKYFAKNDYQIFETPNGRLAREVLNNLGGISGLNFFSRSISHKIIELFENGKIINYHLLVGEIKKNLKNKKNDYAYIIKKLLDNKIVEFGSKIKCSICNQTSFYLLEDLKNNIDCSICRNNFDLELSSPSTIEWAYRGIGPFSKNNKVGGILSIFLALKLFKSEFADMDGKISSLMEFEVKKEGVINEIDLLLLIKSNSDDESPPDLIICECKTYKKITVKDIDRLKKIGTDFPNSILTFCTLNEFIDEEEKELLIDLVNFFRVGFGSRPRNSVLILTSDELIPEENHNYFHQYEPILKSYHKSDYTGSLCELTVEKHLGLKTWGEIQSDIWLRHHQGLTSS